ncbi:MAG: hypothetical protein ACYS18_01435 [Planctomycetota bacterium]
MRVAKLLVIVCCCLLCGCSFFELFEKEQPPYDNELSAGYFKTVLEQSGSADVLGTIHMPEYETLSQSKSVIASVGQKDEGHKIWFKMVAFDENKLTARRKYFFVIDEKGKALFGPRRSLAFDCETVPDRELLNKPYASDGARQIAIMRQVRTDVRTDVSELAMDNKTLDVCGMLINQTLETILRRLDESPVLASKLSDGIGLDFDHITLGEGRAMMYVIGGVVKVNVDISSLTWDFKDDPFAIEP